MELWIDIESDCLIHLLQIAFTLLEIFIMTSSNSNFIHCFSDKWSMLLHCYIHQQNLFNFFMTEVTIYRNQWIDLLSKSMDWFLYDRDLRHERVKALFWAFIT